MRTLLRFSFFILQKIISRLPEKWSYAFSDLLKFFLKNIFCYRRKVIIENLRNAFPEKSESERKKILSAYYSHLSDWIVENMRLLSMTEKEISERVIVRHNEDFISLTEEKRNAIVLFAHHYNWEWLAAATGLLLKKFEVTGLYLPVRDKYFNDALIRMRTQFGNKVTDINNMREILHKLNSKDKQHVIGILSDHTPAYNEQLYFTDFFGRPTAVSLAPARIALKTQSPVYFLQMNQLKRGRYEVLAHNLHAEKFLPYSEENVKRLTDVHTQLLEKIIRENPSGWMWSHRRWKHKPG